MNTLVSTPEKKFGDAPGIRLAVEQSNDYELATDAHEDLTCLSDVFSWVNEIFMSIGDVFEKPGLCEGTKLIRIARLAEMGSNLATNWESTADSMAENFAKVMSARESEMGEVARHG